MVFIKKKSIKTWIFTLTYTRPVPNLHLLYLPGLQWIKPTYWHSPLDMLSLLYTSSSFFYFPVCICPSNSTYRTYSLLYLSSHVHIYLCMPPSCHASLGRCISLNICHLDSNSLCWIQALWLTICVTLRKLFNLSKPVFPYPENRDNHSI